MKHYFLNKKNKILVKEFNNPQTDKAEMALLAFDGKMRDKIIENFNQHFLIEGDHIKNGGISSPKTMLSLLGGSVGSLGLAGVASGQLFMATANPATLMSIGNGVGSAVMGASGIVSQAPFLPVKGALMPVAAPLIAFQALSTITIMKQFKVVNERLDKIQDTLNTILYREEATFIGEVISASNRISEIENQFHICNQFTEDMIFRLALLEDKINPIFERYKYLYKNQSINTDTALRELKLQQTDAYMVVVTSILDIRIDLLKMKINIQNNPGYMETAAKTFVDKIGYYKQLWTTIQNDSSEINKVKEELKAAVSGMNWWQKNMPSWLLGKREKRKENENKVNELEKEASRHKVVVDEPIEFAMEFSESIKPSESKMSLIYWKDDLGEHSYYTDDLLIEEAAAKSI